MRSQGILTTSDNQKIHYDHYACGHERVVVIAHGFFNSKASPLFRQMAEDLSTFFDIFLFDFRGHGESSGRFSWVAKEPRDLSAVLDYAKSLGYKSIGLMGFSLGASVSVIVASKRNDVNSMILISCPISGREIDFNFWEPSMISDLVDNFACKWQGKGARLDIPFLKKEKPIDCVRQLKEIPVFFMHGDKDWIIKERHSRALYKAASQPKKIEIIAGGMHAERLFQQDRAGMNALAEAWFTKTL